MRRALRRGGWALSLTAGLSLTAAAAAQPPGGAAGKALPAPATAARPAAEDLNRARELAVELGWLAASPPARAGGAGSGRHGAGDTAGAGETRSAACRAADGPSVAVERGPGGGQNRGRGEVADRDPDGASRLAFPDTPDPAKDDAGRGAA